jgi:hypothetical protein
MAAVRGGLRAPTVDRHAHVQSLSAPRASLLASLATGTRMCSPPPLHVARIVADKTRAWPRIS